MFLLNEINKNKFLEIKKMQISNDEFHADIFFFMIYY